MGDIIVISVLALVVGLILWSLLHQKKKGKASGCSGCTGCCSGCTACPGKQNTP